MKFENRHFKLTSSFPRWRHVCKVKWWKASVLSEVPEIVRPTSRLAVISPEYCLIGSSVSSESHWDLLYMSDQCTCGSVRVCVRLSVHAHAWTLWMKNPLPGLQTGGEIIWHSEMEIPPILPSVYPFWLAPNLMSPSVVHIDEVGRGGLTDDMTVQCSSRCTKENLKEYLVIIV